MVLCALLFCGGVSYGQSIPPSADPGRLERPSFPEVPAYDLKPAIPHQIAPPALPDEIMEESFVLHSVTINGAVAFSPEQLKTTYEPLLYQTITLRDLYAVVAAIQKRYLDAGFAISRVRLMQPISEDGAAVIEVLEGYVGEVAVDPDIIVSPAIRDFVKQVKVMRPLNTQHLERLMLILNSNPTLQVSAILEPPEKQADDAGAMRLNLKKMEKIEHPSFVSVDNHGSRFTGPVQIKAGTSIRNLAMPYDDLALSGAVTNDMRELRQVAGAYTMPLWGIEGITLRASASYNKTVPGYTLDVLDVEGNALSLGFQIDYPILLQRDENWFISGAFDYKNIETDMLATRLFNDQLRVATLTSRYSASDRYSGVDQVQASLSQGLNILGARETGSPDLSRRYGHSDFTKAELSLSRNQPIGQGFSLLTSARGQYAWVPLLSSEEFGFGGEYSGRGYDPSEITGDLGVVATIEARYASVIDEEWSLQPYTFYDIGRVWNIDPNDKKSVAASSAGVGIRLDSALGWSLDANCATPLTKAAEEPPGYANGNSPRFLINIKKLF